MFFSTAEKIKNIKTNVKYCNICKIQEKKYETGLIFNLTDNWISP